MAEHLWHALQGLPDWLVVTILAAAPVSEGRAAIAVGIAAYHMSLLEVIPLAVIVNVVAVMWVLPLYDWMARAFATTPVLGPIFTFFTHHAAKRKALVEKYGALGLTIFVAIPLPGFGAWTGIVIAAIMRMPFWKATLCMLVGTILMACIVTPLTLAGVGVVNEFQVGQ